MRELADTLHTTAQMGWSQKNLCGDGHCLAYNEISNLASVKHQQSHYNAVSLSCIGFCGCICIYFDFMVKQELYAQKAYACVYKQYSKHILSQPRVWEFFLFKYSLFLNIEKCSIRRVYSREFYFYFFFIAEIPQIRAESLQFPSEK